MLAELLSALVKQETQGRFSYFVRVVDNDSSGSARETVEAFRRTGTLRVEYEIEPRQNISMARNRAVGGVKSDFIAMIDDDEVPVSNWLSLLLSHAESNSADGVLGPVHPLYPEGCPAWLKRSGLCDRPTHPTGKVLNFGETRSGNGMVRTALFAGESEPFKVAFGCSGGEDIDFFRCKMAEGRRFIWCNEAEAYERVPEDRWQLGYYLRRQFRLGGLLGERHPGVKSLLSSSGRVLAHFAFALIGLPMGKHFYGKRLARLCYHAGYVLTVVGLAWNRQREEFAGDGKVQP
jgi:glycosyltransferase involved in cell wall biosynthesis